MSVDTLGVRFSAEGSENILNLIKQITTATGQLDGEIKKLTQTSQQAASGIGPAFSNLGNAISSGEQKVKSLSEKFSGLQSVISKQGTAFGTATASVWGIYNAYDSLEKVQLRASQSTVRVETLTTSLRSQEEQLRLARESGNLTAEQLAVKQERIADTAGKLSVAQERQRIMQEDVNEAWAGFISLVGPQALAAFGSISQLVAGLTQAGEGQISTLGRMRGAFTSLIGSFTLTRTSGLAVNSTFAQMPIFAGAAEVGVRGLSGALKGLLIGTGIGAVLVAIGLLTEGFGLLGGASEDLAKETNANFAEAEKGPDEFMKAIETDLSLAQKIIERFTAEEKKALEEGNIAYIEARIVRNRTIAEEAQAQLNLATDIAAAQYKIRDAIVAARDANFGLISQEDQKRLNDANASIAASEKVVADLKPVADQARAAIGALTQAKTLLAKADFDAAQAQEQYKKSIQSLPQDVQTTTQNVQRWFDVNEKFLLSIKNSDAAIAFATNTITGAYVPGTELAAAANAQLKIELEQLFPDVEKLDKAAEKSANEFQKWIDKAKQLSDQFGVAIPASIIGSDEGLQAFGDTLAKNQEKLDAFNKSAEILKDISGLEEAFNLKVDVEDDVKDFLKGLDKGTRNAIKVNIKFESNWQEMQKIFGILAPGIFSETKDGRVLDFTIRPNLDDKGKLEDIANQMIDILKDHFSKKDREKNPVVQDVIDDLKAADTKEELKAAIETAFKVFGLTGGESILGDPTSDAEKAADIAASAFAAKFGAKVNELGPLGDAVLNLQGGEGVTVYDPKTGKLVNKPREPKGSPTDYTAETKSAEDAAEKIKQTFLELSGKLSNIWLGMAKNWSGIMNSVITNAKAADTGVIKEFLNMSGKASNVFLGLASNWSKMMNSMINNAKAAAAGINKALDGIKDQDVTINVGLKGPGVPYLHHSQGAIHLAGGGIIDSAAKGQVYMTNGPQLVLIGDNPSGNELHAIIPKEDPMPTVKNLIGALGNMGHHTTSNSAITTNNNISNFGMGSGPIIINVTQPIYLDSKLIGENISRQSIDNLDRFFRS